MTALRRSFFGSARKGKLLIESLEGLDDAGDHTPPAELAEIKLVVV